MICNNSILRLFFTSKINNQLILLRVCFHAVNLEYCWKCDKYMKYTLHPNYWPTFLQSDLISQFNDLCSSVYWLHKEFIQEIHWIISNITRNIRLHDFNLFPLFELLLSCMLFPIILIRPSTSWVTGDCVLRYFWKASMSKAPEN